MERGTGLLFLNALWIVFNGLLFIVGLVGIFGTLFSGYREFDNQTLCYSVLFLVGGFSLSTQLFLLNFKSVRGSK